MGHPVALITQVKKVLERLVLVHFGKQMNTALDHLQFVNQPQLGMDDHQPPTAGGIVTIIHFDFSTAFNTNSLFS